MVHKRKRSCGLAGVTALKSLKIDFYIFKTDTLTAVTKRMRSSSSPSKGSLLPSFVVAVALEKEKVFALRFIL